VGTLAATVSGNDTPIPEPKADSAQPATSQPTEQPQKHTAPAFQPSVEGAVIGTWSGELTLGIRGLYTFYEDNTCQLWHITPDGYYTDFGAMAADGKDLVNNRWKVSKQEGGVQTIVLAGADGEFTFTGDKLYWRGLFEFSRVTSPDAMPKGKFREVIIPPIDSDSFLVGTFTGAELECSWGEPTGEIVATRPVTFNADGTNDLITGLGEPYYWSVKERNVTATARVQNDDSPCKWETVTVTGQRVTMGMKYADGSWKMSSNVFVFEYGGYTYIDSKKYRRTK
jgi:hypothetical protein